MSTKKEILIEITRKKKTTATEMISEKGKITEKRKAEVKITGITENTTDKADNIETTLTQEKAGTHEKTTGKETDRRDGKTRKGRMSTKGKNLQ